MEHGSQQSIFGYGSLSPVRQRHWRYATALLGSWTASITGTAGKLRGRTYLVDVV